ncbi:MAG TPA: hypothetical protein VLB81_16505 [Gaiellales bacterium]|nr:hypothetical protein [Gaiellales bacterium]
MTAKTARAWVVTGALALGAAAGAAGIANAASGANTQGSTGSGTPAFAANGSPMQPRGGPDPAAMSHGPGETDLTGAAASRARAAARAAVPGATVIRVETDSAGAAYEAHLRRSDGTFVTVELDKGFDVTGTQSGFGGPAR